MEDKIENIENPDEMSLAGSVGGTIAKPIVSFMLPKGWNWLMNKIYGKKVLIVGPGRTGKTSFRNFLLNGVLLNEGQTPKTSNHSSKNGKILKSKNGSFEISLKTLTDSPGQIGPIIHARSISDFKPHFLFVFLSCDRMDECAIWFEDFCENLYPVFRDDPYLAKNINSIFIILNKVDKVKGKTKAEIKKNLRTFMDKIKDIAIKELNHVYYKIGDQVKLPVVLPAMCVKNNEANGHLEEIINTMANNI